MKRLLFFTTLLAVVGTPAWGAPTISFTSAVGDPDPGNWVYTPAGPGAGVISFDQPITVDSAFGAGTDPIVGLQVFLPTFNLSGSGGTYAFNPTGPVEVRDGGTVHLRGTLAPGTLTAIGTGGNAYPFFAIDLTGITSPSGNAIGSAAIDLFLDIGQADIDLHFSGAVSSAFPPTFTSFQQMVDQAHQGQDGLTGSATAIIPAPGALLLAAVGTGLLGWVRQRRFF